MPMRKNSAFSLAKTLLVSGGLLVVGVIFFPVLFGPGRETGHRTPPQRCQSNLKQIMLGVKQYFEDYDEVYPPLNAGHLPETKTPSKGWVNSLQPYLKSLQIFQCPSEFYSHVGDTDYAYNSGVFGSARRVRLNEPAGTVILCEIDEKPGALASASGPLVNNRHLDGSNYAFVDGHVKWLRSDKAPSPSNVRETGSNFTFGS